MKNPTVLENVSLKPYNTFGIEAKARYWAIFEDVETLQALLTTYSHVPHLFLGEGSNILFTQDFEGIVLCNRIKHITLKDNPSPTINDTHVHIEVGAGYNWHQFVLYCLENGYYGLENLSLIYGTVGASPMQNIGAYGVEVKQFITQVHAYHIPTGKVHTFTNEACAFGYRSSIFKTTEKGKYCILSVVFALPTIPALRLDYGDITKTLEAMNITSPTPQQVSQAVIHIRQQKLPNPTEVGNAGSFFKNPEITVTQFEVLQKQYPSLPAYPAQQMNEVKIPAGWLIEQAGWKGRRVGDAGVHNRQALVLVNYGNATGKDIWQLAIDIQTDVWQKFNVHIVPEVNVI